MVRSNTNGEIGFLQNEKRMNVAVTRSKRLCVLIGDSGTVNKNKFLKSLVDYFKEHGTVRSGFDYLGNDEVRQGYGKKGNNNNVKE
jgi:ATP-dependent RNA/DNA helicase IGHMBP2